MNLKECVNSLKSKLYCEVEDYEKQKMECEEAKNKKDILNELIRYLSSDIEVLDDNLFLIGMQLPLVYPEKEANRIYEMITVCIFEVKNNSNTTMPAKLKTLHDKMKSDFEEYSNRALFLEKKLYFKKTRMIECRRILSNYKYNGLITSSQIDLIEKIMNKYQMDNKDQIRIFESVRIHNLKVKSSDMKISYTVVNMLDDNYQKYDIDEISDVSYRESLKGVIDSFYRSLKLDEEIGDVISIMPSLNESDKGYTFDETEYIHKSIINKFTDDLIELINSISNPEIYHDIELRKVVIEEYNDLKNRYRKILYNYNLQKQNYVNTLRKEKNEDNVEVVNNLFYQYNNLESGSYLEKDLSSFPEEYLKRVRMLLDGKKTDTLSFDNDRGFNGSKRLKGYRELRYDQVRIIYKPLNYNNYLVLGAFVKKSDNDRNRYFTITSRNDHINVSEEELENASMLENRIYNLISEKSRKGNR